MMEEKGSYVGREKFDVGNVHVLCVGSGMKEIEGNRYWFFIGRRRINH